MRYDRPNIINDWATSVVVYDARCLVNLGVFLGFVQADFTENSLINTFEKFASIGKIRLSCILMRMPTTYDMYTVVPWKTESIGNDTRKYVYDS